MGKQLVSQYSGQCKECDTKYSKGDTIYWDGTKKINCKDLACFSEQGGEITSNQSTFAKKSSYTFKPKTTYTDKMMTSDDSLNIRLDVDVEGDSARLVEYIREANDLAKKLYPNLTPNTQTFGQIRNSLVAHLIALNKGS